MTTQELLTVTTTTRPKRIAFLVQEGKFTTDVVDGIIEFNCRHWGGRFNPIILTSGNEITSDWWSQLVAVDPDIIYSFGGLCDALIDKINRHILPSRIFDVDPDDIRRRGGVVGVDGHQVAALTTVGIPRLLWARRSAWKDPVFQFVLSTALGGSTRDFALRNFGILPGDMTTRAMFNDMSPRVIDVASASMDEYLDMSGINGLQQQVFPMDLCSAFARFAYAPSDHAAARGFHLVIGDSPWDALYAWNIKFQRPVYAGRDFLWLPSCVASDDAFLATVGKWIGKMYWGDGGNRCGSVVSYSLDVGVLKAISEKVSPLAHLYFEPKRLATGAHPFPASFDNVGRFPGGGDEISLTISEQVGVSEDKFLSRVAVPEFQGRDGARLGWMIEANVSFRPENYSHTNVRPHWRIPKRLGVPQLFIGNENIHARSDWAGRPCFETEGYVEALYVRIPSDIAVMQTCIFPSRHSNFNGAGSTPLADSAFVNLQTSDKGRYLRGLVRVFGGLYQAGRSFDDQYWRAIFYDLVGRDESNVAEKKRVVLVRKTIDDFLKDRTISGSDELLMDELSACIAKKLTFRDNPDLSITLKELKSKFKTIRHSALQQDAKSSYWHAYQKFDAVRESELSRLVTKNILFQGVEIRCPHCFTTHWHAVGSLESTLQCEGCTSIFPFPLKTEWAFRLNKLVSNAIKSHGTLSVLLALYSIQSHISGQGMFMYLPCQDLFIRNEKEKDNVDDNFEFKDGELQFNDGRQYTDLDIVVISAGKFKLGEVKSSPGAFSEEEFAKLRRIGSEIRPDELILAAVGDAWPPAVSKQIDSLKIYLAEFGVVVSPVLLQWPDG